MASPRVTPPTVAPATNHEAVARYECPFPRSPKGVMVESMDRPHGDQVDRTAAATATAAPTSGSQTVMVMPPIRRRWC